MLTVHVVKCGQTLCAHTSYIQVKQLQLNIAGQFLKADVVIDTNFLRFENHPYPIPVRKAPAWHYLGISDDCWYGVSTDNQGSGIIEGNFMDYVVQQLV